jgi:hypothetical protein
LDSLNRCTWCGCRPCARQIRCTELMLLPTALAIAAAVQCVTSLGGSLLASVTTSSITELTRPDTGAGQQDDPGPPNMLLRAAVSHNRLETSTIGDINGESDSCAHPADSHTQQAAGISCRSLSLDLIH